MGAASTAQVTALLLRWNQGDEHALDSLIPLVYPDLRKIAGYQMKGEKPNHTLQPTALVNELYIKIGAEARFKFMNRAHFLAVSARAMRQILIDHARKNKAKKRAAVLLPLDDVLAFTPAESGQMLALDEALERLAQEDVRKARLVELRYFGGLSDDEIAAILDISPRTVNRDWAYAKAWLRRAMDNGNDLAAAVPAS